MSFGSTLDDVTKIVSTAVRDLVRADGATIVLRDGERCRYVDEDAIGPLWKGSTFPLEACISGWVIRSSQAVAIEDVYADDRIPHAAYRPTFVKSLAMVPIRRQSPLGAIGAYWASQRLARTEDLEILQALADTAAVALANVELHDAAERQRHRLTLLDGLADALVTFAPDLTIRTWSRGAEETYGWTASEAVGRSIAELLRGRHLDGTRQEMLDRLATEHRWAGEILQWTKDGRQIRVAVRAAAIIGDRGEVIAIASVNRDVTVHRRAEHAARRLAAIVESSDDAIISKRLDGTIETWNAGAERLYGYRAGEIVGDPIARIVPAHKQDELNAMLACVKRGEHVAPIETNRLRRDGSLVDVSIAMSPILDDDGRTIGVSTIARDITQRRRLEQELALSQRLASLGTLAAGVAHEINNPLTYVVANLDTLRAALQPGSELTAEQHEELGALLDDVLGGTQRIGRIVRGLTVFSRADEGPRTAVDLHEAVDVAVTMATPALRHRARLVRTDGVIPAVSGDPGQLAQVFANLLVNAAQAIPEGSIDAHTVGVVTSTDANGNAVVEVSDTGAGIPEAIRHRIFEPFFTSKPVGTGTGLGLALVRTIVTAHGGTIGFETEVGRGSTFRVVFPPGTRDAAMVRTPTSVASEPIGMRTRILVVDDEPQLTKLFARLLAREHDVVVANNGREAFEIFRRDPRFDAILCDVMMPDVGGIALYHLLHDLAPEHVARMIFMTGGAFDAQSQAFLASIPNPCLRKPFQIETLNELLRRVTARRV